VFWYIPEAGATTSIKGIETFGFKSPECGLQARYQGGGCILVQHGRRLDSMPACPCWPGFQGRPATAFSRSW
jgi:hypothetical protein